MQLSGHTEALLLQEEQHQAQALPRLRILHDQRCTFARSTSRHALRCLTPAATQEETWVTIYGFQPSELHVVLREFSKSGDIAHFGSGRQDAVNWVHIHYAVRCCPAGALCVCRLHVARGAVPCSGAYAVATVLSFEACRLAEHTAGAPSPAGS